MSETLLRPAVLGHAIAKGDDGQFCLLVDGQSVLRGGLDDCEQALLESLLELYGKGNTNLSVPTLGGVQLWADMFWYSGWRIQEHVYTGHFRLLDRRNVRQAWGSYAQCRTFFENARSQQNLSAPAKHLVVLLHGLGRRASSFSTMSSALEDAGFATASLVYPSTRRNLSEHAEQLSQFLGRLEGIETVSFVTHSLGGVVVRKLLNEDSGDWRKKINLGRVLMLAPPNQGSQFAEILKDFLPFSKLAGPSGQQLSDATKQRSATLNTDYEFAIVAGAKGDGKGWNPLLPGDDDGVVSVAETKLPGAAYFAQVKRIHTFIMSAPEVIEMTINFLKGDGLCVEQAKSQ